MPSKKAPKAGLVKTDQAPEAGLSMEQVMSHPVVKEMGRKLDEMRQLVQGLPEAIGRAVAEAQRQQRVPRASGPPVPLRAENGGVEFHRKGKIIQNGEVVAKEGPTSLSRDLPATFYPPEKPKKA